MGNPSYAGTLDLYATSEGVVMVNELPLENYLCKVVPSEMPASYQKEALKAQAICARSYAYRQIMDYAYPEYQAHVNDSTDYQVYNNSASQQAATEAVQETAGKVLKYNGNIIIRLLLFDFLWKDNNDGCVGNEREGRKCISSVCRSERSDR